MKPNDPIDIEPDMTDDFSDEEFIDQDLGDDTVYDDDDGEIYDENWEDADAPAPTPARKKKGSLFNMLLIGAAVFIGGGILAYQFGGKSAPSPAPASEQTAGTAGGTQGVASDTPPGPDENSLLAMQQADEQGVPEAPSDASKPAGQKGFMDDPSQLDQAGAQQNPSAAPGLPEQGPSMTGFDDGAAPAPALNPGDKTTLAQSDAGATPTKPSAAPAISDLPVPQNLPNINLIKKAELPSPSTTATPAKSNEKPSEPPVVVTNVKPGPSVKESELESKLDDAEEKIAELEKKLSEKPTPALASAPVQDNSAEVETLRSTIAQLESKVATLSASAVSKPNVSRPSAPASDDEPQDRPAPIKRAAKRPVVKSSRKADETYVAQKNESTVPQSYSSYQTSEKWELRGASPGVAMLGKMGEASIRTIRVGDNVAGIGQILSINQVGGAWIVQGTGGTVTQ